MSTLLNIVCYRIMQIVRGGKASRLHDLLVIRGKTFAIVQQFETPYNRKAKNLLENLRDRRLIRENRKSFPPRMICIIRYITIYTYVGFLMCYELGEGVNGVNGNM